MSILSTLKKHNPDKVNRYLHKARAIADHYGKDETRDPDYWGYIETVLAKIVPKSELKSKK